MKRTRTFIAIDLGKTIRRRLLTLQDKLAETEPGVKWVECDNLHLTLLFLGEVNPIDLPALCKAVEDTTKKHRPFTMSVESVGCFPNTRRPRIVWVGVGEGRQDVVALHDDLEHPLLELGCYRREERKYTPHVTLGRIRAKRPVEDLSGVIEKKAGWKGGEIPVSEIRVMSSELTPDGPIYTVLSRAKLLG